MNINNNLQNQGEIPHLLFLAFQDGNQVAQWCGKVVNIYKCLECLFHIGQQQVKSSVNCTCQW